VNEEERRVPTEPNTAPACSLTGADLATRVHRWQSLAGSSLLAREATDAGVRLAFRPDRAVVHDLVDLLDGERGCCGWAQWSLTSTGERAVVEATTEPRHVRALHDLFGVIS
jgi:hypothetical protein